MKKRLIILYFSVAATVIICTLILSIGATGVKKAPAPEKEEKLDFTLSLYENRPALFDGNSLLEVYDDIAVSSLPPADQTALKDGIKIDSFAQLYTLLEDFDG